MITLKDILARSMLIYTADVVNCIEILSLASPAQVDKIYAQQDKDYQLHEFLQKHQLEYKHIGSVNIGEYKIYMCSCGVFSCRLRDAELEPVWGLTMSTITVREVSYIVNDSKDIAIAAAWLRYVYEIESKTGTGHHWTTVLRERNR